MPNSIDPSLINLPIREVIPEVKEKLTANHTLILSSPPGAGKSTLLPLALLDEPWLSGKKIILLEPRRLAASSIAHRMASLLGERVGGTVGYRIRFENQTSSKTRIEVVTEGILTRLLHQDNALSEVGLVIFDEFHERRLHSEVSLMLCRESQQILRPDLRIMVMSATVDVHALSSLLRAPMVQSQGRQYPISHHYLEDTDVRSVAQECARTIALVAKKHEGDMLAFLPGEAEIRQCETLLTTSLATLKICPLYGQLSHHEQQAAIQPDMEGRRKVVLATSIAETSLTIEGISIVVDTGYTRTMKYDPASQLTKLHTTRISRDAADQRAGRAGRLGPGICYRMWTPATHSRLKEYRQPEILEADLTPMALDMLQWGIRDITAQPWITMPPAGSLAQALETLQLLGAQKDNGVTPHGKQLHALPCHPRIAHLLIKSKELSVADTATDLAAIIEERDPLSQSNNVDISFRITALRRHRNGHKQGKRFDNIEKIARSYRKLIQAKEDNEVVDHYLCGLLLAFAYPERIAQLVSGTNGVFKLANGRRATIGMTDDMAHENWISIAHMDAREGTGKIFLAAPLHESILARFSQKTERIYWDTPKGGIVANTDEHIGGLVIKSQAITSPDKARVQQVVMQAIREEGRQLLNFSDQVTQWQNRVLSLRIWNTDTEWPDVNTELLLSRPEEWLAFYIQNPRKTEDLKQINLVNVLQASLGYEQQQALHRLAPETILVPSGSHIKLQYFADGSIPVLAVRLQELFGLLETPLINNGKQPVLLHVLSPGFKPIQVTQDLHSFWTSTYFEVRKELKRRYPKHAWPEEPLKAQAISGAKRRKL